MAPPVPTTTRSVPALARDVVRAPSGIGPLPAASVSGRWSPVRRPRWAIGSIARGRPQRPGPRASRRSKQWRRAFAQRTLHAGHDGGRVHRRPAVLCRGRAGGRGRRLVGGPARSGHTGRAARAACESVLTRTGARTVLADRPAGAGMRAGLGRARRRWCPPTPKPGRAAAPLVASGGVVLSSSGTTGPPKVARLASRGSCTPPAAWWRTTISRRTIAASTRCRSSTSTPRWWRCFPRSSPVRASCSTTASIAPASGRSSVGAG